MTQETAITTAHSFDPVTREYVLPVKVYSDGNGGWLLPDNTVLAKPKRATVELEALRLNATGKAWEIVPDYRRRMLWDKATAAVAANDLQLGQVPAAGATHLPPLPIPTGAPQRNAWNARNGSWGLVPDYSAIQLYEKASGQHAAPLEAGTALPPHLTDIAPPRDQPGPWVFVDADGMWILAPAPAEPDPTPIHGEADA
ncbi:hypothetical protein [Stenotrophomonas sp. Iso1]|uniref:hypothetical protein n=1 Tax=Stenotrophomonas sp. Iso1 TaxID=2977283 RepID=UPI0022B7BB9D|nr:hypothetical protein [Stenotrophomonas sp. Iso1]